MEGQANIQKDTQFEDAARAVAEIFKFFAGLGGGQAPGTVLHPLGSNRAAIPFNQVPQVQVRVPPGIGQSFLG